MKVTSSIHDRMQLDWRNGIILSQLLFYMHKKMMIMGKDIFALSIYR